MSAYIPFVLKRAGVPTPRTVTILVHEQTWVNWQIAEEFRAVFPLANVTITPKTDSADLVVIPYMDDFYRETPGGITMYKQLQTASQTWVMLYGVGYRKVDVMSAPELFRYYRRCARTVKRLWYVRRLHLTKVGISLIRAGIVLS